MVKAYTNHSSRINQIYGGRLMENLHLMCESFKSANLTNHRMNAKKK